MLRSSEYSALVKHSVLLQYQAAAVVRCDRRSVYYRRSRVLEIIIVARLCPSEAERNRIFQIDRS